MPLEYMLFKSHHLSNVKQLYSNKDVKRKKKAVTCQEIAMLYITTKIMNSTARQTSFQLDFLFLLSWAARNLNRCRGEMPYVQNVSMILHLKNLYKNGEANDKTHADATAGIPDDQDIWTGLRRSIIGVEASFGQWPSPWQGVLDSKQRVWPQHPGFSSWTSLQVALCSSELCTCSSLCLKYLLPCFSFFYLTTSCSSLRSQLKYYHLWEPTLTSQTKVPHVFPNAFQSPRTWKALITLDDSFVLLFISPYSSRAPWGQVPGLPCIPNVE